MSQSPRMALEKVIMFSKSNNNSYRRGFIGDTGRSLAPGGSAGVAEVHECLPPEVVGAPAPQRGRERTGLLLLLLLFLFTLFTDLNKIYYSKFWRIFLIYDNSWFCLTRKK